MPEREQPGVAEQKVEAERGNGGDQAIDEELRLVEAGDQRHQGERNQDCERGGGKRELRAKRGRGAGVHHAPPNKPVGLTSSTSAAIRKRIASSSSGKKWEPAR